MANLRPSNVKVIFQRPSCDEPYSIAVASGSIAGSAAVIVCRYGGFLCSLWCLDVGGSGRRRAGLDSVMGDGGEVCATAMHCLISRVCDVFFNFVLFLQ